MPSARQFDPNDPELMDRPQPVSPELKKDLENLRSLNQLFGSHALIRWFMKPRLSHPLTILDLATGSGDIPRLLVDLARKHNLEIQVTALDFQEATLEIAKEWSSGYPEIHYKKADLLEYPFDEPHDLVLCSLALHHFTEESAIAIMRGMLTARKSALVADLRRCALATVGVDILTRTLYREPMTRNDATVSAARAFSFEEMSDMARQAGWKNFGHRRFRFGRQALWIDQPLSK